MMSFNTQEFWDTRYVLKGFLNPPVSQCCPGAIRVFLVGTQIPALDLENSGQEMGI